MDNTGKTTLVDKLKLAHPHLEYRPSIGNKHDRDFIREQAANEAYDVEKMRWVISDRSRIISEYIYTPVVGGRDIAYSLDTYTEFLASFARGHHLVIHCYRSTAKIIDGWDEREQLEGVRSHLSEIASRYDQVMHMLRFLFAVGGGKGKVIQYTFESNNDYTPEFFPIVSAEVRRYIEEEEKA
jgi:hypothetical protein